MRFTRKLFLAGDLALCLMPLNGCGGGSGSLVTDALGPAPDSLAQSGVATIVGRAIRAGQKDHSGFRAHVQTEADAEAAPYFVGAQDDAASRS